MHIIDPEFQKIIPSLSSDEYAKLETNILAEGVRDPLVVWAGHDILLDGHNRLQICQVHNLSFETTEVHLPSRQAAIKWIVDNQLGRRNLTPEAVSYLRGKRYEAEKLNPTDTLKQNAPLHQNDGAGTTAQRLASEYSVSKATIERDGQFTRAVDTLAEVAGDDVKAAILGREARITRQDVMALARVAANDSDSTKELIDLVVSGEAKNLRDAVRQHRRQKYEEQQEEAPLPQRKYRVLYADPPWHYGNSGLDEYGHAKRHYDTLTVDELCVLDIAELTADDAVLFLWATSPMLEDAFTVIRAWGFQYKTSFVWDKMRHNFGYYNSVRHEFLLIATRGSCLPDTNKLHDSVIQIERTDWHSHKPAYFRELIDSLYCNGARIELFAREQPDGWDVWGNEISRHGR